MRDLSDYNENERPSCSVTEALLMDVIDILPKKYSKLSLDMKRTLGLFLLGFDITRQIYLIRGNGMIRDKDYPYKKYSIEGGYINGSLRQEVDYVEGNKIIFNSDDHWLKKYYDKYTILDSESDRARAQRQYLDRDGA